MPIFYILEKTKKEGVELKNKNLQELMKYSGKYKVFTYLSLICVYMENNKRSN